MDLQDMWAMWVGELEIGWKEEIRLRFMESHDLPYCMLMLGLILRVVGVDIG
ncbi:5098_t:CDS:2 [Dentiscutata heterogama]|uniref:5098_t:CDS:1 n=1 Tax=Dentiscutata heterogama TaxID=1316150 RepID=A0ACA9K7U2_9GLOM|nr:5098_t:CDS:2 [Dentiscutata heterogama]